MRKGKILVCAHSNAAVDELLGRMLSGRASFVDEFGRQYTPSIVRLGSGSTESVAPVTLEARATALRNKTAAALAAHSTGQPPPQPPPQQQGQQQQGQPPQGQPPVQEEAAGRGAAGASAQVARREARKRALRQLLSGLEGRKVPIPHPSPNPNANPSPNPNPNPSPNPNPNPN